MTFGEMYAVNNKICLTQETREKGSPPSSIDKVNGDNTSLSTIFILVWAMGSQTGCGGGDEKDP